jgi:hypothetical protein
MNRTIVIPAKAGIQLNLFAVLGLGPSIQWALGSSPRAARSWTPAFAGVTSLR